MSNGTLAEWLSRGPAKPVPSGARVRISQVSHTFAFYLSAFILYTCTYVCVVFDCLGFFNLSYFLVFFL
jgi:hypothetical protein